MYAGIGEQKPPERRLHTEHHPGAAGANAITDHAGAAGTTCVAYQRLTRGGARSKLQHEQLAGRYGVC